MTTLPFISACHSMMASEVGEPRRVGGPTRHSMAPIRHGALFLASFLGVRTLWARATSCWRPNTTWRSPNTTWRARFALFLGGFGPLKLEPRRVGGPTRHGGLPMRRGALVLLPFGPFWRLWAGATSCWRPNTTWKGTIQCDAPLSGHFNKKATSELSQRWQVQFLFGFLFA